MTERAAAEEHLRVIRSLMERSTIYRAISAEAAAVGGVLAIIASFAFGNWLPWRADAVSSASGLGAGKFLAVWIATLIFAAGANLLFVYRASTRRNEPFVSSGMKLAILALLPGFLVAAWLTFHIFFGDETACVPVWITCYGLALLATKSFAPSSLVRLGWAFLLAGLLSLDVVTFTFAESFSKLPTGVEIARVSRNHLDIANGLMAVTFGLFHLIYAACTWPRGAARGEPVAKP